MSRPVRGLGTRRARRPHNAASAKRRAAFGEVLGDVLIVIAAVPGVIGGLRLIATEAVNGPLRARLIPTQRRPTGLLRRRHTARALSQPRPPDAQRTPQPVLPNR